MGETLVGAVEVKGLAGEVMAPYREVGKRV